MRPSKKAVEMAAQAIAIVWVKTEGMATAQDLAYEALRAAMIKTSTAYPIYKAFGFGLIPLEGERGDIQITDAQVNPDASGIVHLVKPDYRPLGVKPWPKAGEGRAKP